jgi:outer membrane lipoprotein-sorting protein
VDEQSIFRYNGPQDKLNLMGPINVHLGRNLVRGTLLFLLVAAVSLEAQQLDEAFVIRGVDATVQARQNGIASYTVTEHYRVFRNNDENHPAAEMTVKTDYQRDTGKNYTILAQGGSEVLRRVVLNSILENEKRINQPGVREGSWLTSANYEMKLKPGGPQPINGRDCYVLSIKPRQKLPNLIVGTLWVDTRDESIVKIEGTSSKGPSVFTGPVQVMRQYDTVDGFAEATHARATSSSFLFGPTVVTIDYSDYHIQFRPK